MCPAAAITLYMYMLQGTCTCTWPGLDKPRVSICMVCINILLHVCKGVKVIFDCNGKHQICISTFNLIFQPLELVSRYRDPQPQVVENYS